MLDKIERLRAQMREHLKTAQSIAARADDAGRDFTAEEREIAEERLAEAKRLGGEIKRAQEEARDTSVSAAIRNLAEETGGYGEVGYTTDSRVKSLGGTTWGTTLVREHCDPFGGFKALAPSGATVVTVPVAPQPVRESEPVLALRQLLPSERDQVGVWAYLRQTLRDHNAAVVPAGQRKPTSRYELARVDGRSATIAHLSEPIARQDLADAPLLQSFVDTELRLGLEEALEDEILHGDGTGDRFTGLNSVSGTQSQAFATDLMITTRQAVTKLEVLSLTGSGWIMHPADWERVELAANATGYQLTQAGQSIPIERASRRLWGIPVVLCTNATVGTGWLADFTDSTTLKVREDVRIDWSENMYDPDALGVGSGASDFERNMIRFRCEGRFGFAVTRPAGVVKVALAAA